MAKKYKLIDLFAGCGGMTRGFVDTGRFEPVLAVEWDKHAAETYGLNFGADHVVCGDIKKVLDIPSADVVIGGPPCQGFSLLNKKGVGLERRGLWQEYFRVLEASGAQAFVMENVPELLGSEEYLAFEDAAERAGYVVDGRILNAADYGVPQTRRRTIVIGVKDRRPLFSEPTHAKKGEGGLPAWRSFRDAVKGLPLKPDEHNRHQERNPTPLSIERYKAIPNEGEGRFELATRRLDITPVCWQKHTRGSTDVFGRLWWDRPAFTIRTEFYKPEKGRYLHPSEHRPITLREGARCMTLPDEFIFPEHQSMTAVGKQIGNAVPSLLARRIAERLVKTIDGPAWSEDEASEWKERKQAERAAAAARLKKEAVRKAPRLAKQAAAHAVKAAEDAERRAIKAQIEAESKDEVYEAVVTEAVEARTAEREARLRLKAAEAELRKATREATAAAAAAEKRKQKKVAVEATRKAARSRAAEAHKAARAARASADKAVKTAEKFDQTDRSV